MSEYAISPIYATDLLHFRPEQKNSASCQTVEFLDLDLLYAKSVSIFPFLQESRLRKEIVFFFTFFSS